MDPDPTPKKFQSGSERNAEKNHPKVKFNFKNDLSHKVMASD